MTTPSTLTVGICTFRRESLTDAVASLAGQTLRPDLVLVADNDETDSARARTGSAAARYGLDIRYVHAPARNLSVARNACLDGAGRYLAFLDDDETAPSNWLAELTKALPEGSAGVSGPSRAIYPESAPAWMRRVSPHSQAPPRLHGQTVLGNCLLDLAHPALRDLRFDPRFGRSGGEDADYFQRAVARGAVFAVADIAVDEPVTPERLSEAWLAERRRRAGRTWYASLSEERHRKAAAAAGKALWCRAAQAAPREDDRRRAWLRGLFHEGVVQAALGVRPRDHYGAPADPAS